MNNTSEHRSTARVLDILLLLSRNNDGYSLAEIAKKLNAPKSSLFPIIHTMCNRNFIQFIPSTTKYRIGQQAYLAGNSYVSSRPVYDFILNQMNYITASCNETCHLGILLGSNVLYIAKKEVLGPIMLRSHVGKQLPAYCTGIGKSLLINYTLEELKKLYSEPLPAYTPNTITDLNKLKSELDIAHKTGFTYENAELTEGISCIGIPLRYKEKVIAALSICYPQFHSSQDFLTKAKELLLKVQKEIELYFSDFGINDSSYLF